MTGFAVTYETVSEESAREGDAAERGFINAEGLLVQAIIGKPTPGVRMKFREAFNLFQQERDWTHVEADCYPISPDNPPSWFTDSGEIQFASGECRAISLHLPENVTGSSAMRIARLLNCYGVELC